MTICPRKRFQMRPSKLDKGFLGVNEEDFSSYNNENILKVMGLSLQRKFDGKGFVDTDNTTTDFEVKPLRSHARPLRQKSPLKNRRNKGSFPQTTRPQQQKAPRERDSLGAFVLKLCAVLFRCAAGALRASRKTKQRGRSTSLWSALARYRCATESRSGLRLYLRPVLLAHAHVALVAALGVLFASLEEFGSLFGELLLSAWKRTSPVRKSWKFSTSVPCCRA